MRKLFLLRRNPHDMCCERIFRATCGDWCTNERATDVGRKSRYLSRMHYFFLYAILIVVISCVLCLPTDQPGRQRQARREKKTMTRVFRIARPRTLTLIHFAVCIIHTHMPTPLQYARSQETMFVWIKERCCFVQKHKKHEDKNVKATHFKTVLLI